LKGKIFYVVEHVRARTTLEISWRPAGGPRPPRSRTTALEQYFTEKHQITFKSFKWWLSPTIYWNTKRCPHLHFVKKSRW